MDGHVVCGSCFFVQVINRDFFCMSEIQVVLNYFIHLGEVVVCIERPLKVTEPLYCLCSELSEMWSTRLFRQRNNKTAFDGSTVMLLKVTYDCAFLQCVFPWDFF